MNIEELKKVWDSENQKLLYTIDEQAMDQIILKKSESANRKGEIIENFIFWMNIIVPLILLTLLVVAKQDNMGTYLTCGFMFSAAAYIQIMKAKRRKMDDAIGSSVLDHLDQAIYNATQIAKITNNLLKWYITIIGLLSMLVLYLDQVHWGFLLGMAVVFVVAFLAGRWEQKAWHEKRRDDLIALKAKVLGDT